MDEWILNKMRTYPDYKDKSMEELELLIKRGQEIMDEDDRVLREEKVLRSHYHLPAEDTDAMATASQYNAMVEVRAREGDAFFDQPYDEEE